MNTLLYNKIKKEDFISFLENEGIKVFTHTKARGNLGICLKKRIDVSKHAPEHRIIPILAHEYAHQIHSELEKDHFRHGGSLEKLFKTDGVEIFNNELIRVTHFVDENSLFLEYRRLKEEINKRIKELSNVIKLEYPDFKRSEEFKEMKKYFKRNNSKAKYFLKYDHIKIISPIFRKEEFFTIKKLDEDFPEIPTVFRTYLKLLSFQRKQKRLSARKNRLDKYYKRPTELFARFIEGLFIDDITVKKIAPRTFKRFKILIGQGYFGNLRKLLQITSKLDDIEE